MSFLSKLFGSEKKDTTYNGPRPVSSRLKVSGGPEVFNTMKARLAGEGVGFGDDYADKYSNPIIANLRNRFRTQTMPELTSELSATGRRKGTSGFNQIARAYQDQDLEEGDVFSRLQMRNEDQQRAEINDALEGLDRFSQGETDLIARNAAFEYGDHNRQVAEADTRRQREATGYQNLLTAGADAAAGFYGGEGAFKRQAAPMPVMSYGTSSYRTSTPPEGYDYKNITARLAARSGQAGRVK